MFNLVNGDFPFINDTNSFHCATTIGCEDIFCPIVIDYVTVEMLYVGVCVGSTFWISCIVG